MMMLINVTLTLTLTIIRGYYGIGGRGRFRYITFAKMHNYALRRVERHLPFVRPFQKTVEITLNCSSIIIIINFGVQFGVIRKLHSDSLKTELAV